MRESIGGTWLFSIVIIFIILFASFLTYSISYTKAFNTKNKIIEIIEQNEGFNTSNGANTGNNTQDKVLNYIKSIGYNYSEKENVRCEANEEPMEGYCIRKICANQSDKDSDVHYKVTTYIVLEIPIIGLKIDIPVSGETRLIKTDIWGMECAKD